MDMAKRTSITLPIRDAELIHAVLMDAGSVKLRSLADSGLAGINMSGMGSIELQLARQLLERIKSAKSKNHDQLEMDNSKANFAETR
jgi:hypothetical protein